MLTRPRAKVRQRCLHPGLRPILNTLLYAGTATLIGMTASTVICCMIVKKRNAFTPLLDYLGALPLDLSGTAIGIGLAMSFNSG